MKLNSKRKVNTVKALAVVFKHKLVKTANSGHSCSCGVPVDENCDLNDWLTAHRLGVLAS